MVIFLLLASSGIAQSPGSEIGDAVFREWSILDPHAAIYRYSKSTGYGTVVGYRTFIYFLMHCFQTSNLSNQEKENPLSRLLVVSMVHDILLCFFPG